MTISQRISSSPLSSDAPPNGHSLPSPIAGIISSNTGPMSCSASYHFAHDILQAITNNCVSFTTHWRSQTPLYAFLAPISSRTLTKLLGE